jgi:hypothetical protein
MQRVWCGLLRPHFNPQRCNVQLDLEYGSDHRADEARVRLLAALRQAIEFVGLKEMSYRLDVSPTYLSDALHERDRKSVRLAWLPSILIAVPEAARAELLAEIAGVVGYTVQRAKVLTDAEWRARMESELKASGVVGEELLKRVMR